MKKESLLTKITILNFSLAAVLVASIVVSGLYLDSTCLSRHAINKSRKPYNTQHQPLSEEYRESVYKFTEKFFNAAYAEGENLVFTPLSTINNLYFLYDITTGKAQEEIKSVVGIDDIAFDHKKEATKMVLNTSIDRDNTEVMGKHMFSDVSQGVFFSYEKEELLNSIVQKTKETYYSDYYRSSKNSIRNLLEKKYMKEKTNGTINDYFDSEASDINLVDATYLSGHWEWNCFFYEDRSITFSNINGEKHDGLPYLAFAYPNPFYIKEGKQYYLIGFELSDYYYLNFLLPKENYNPEEVIRNQMNEFIMGTCQADICDNVYFVDFPKISAKCTIPTEKVLKNMGINNVFSNRYFDGLTIHYSNQFTEIEIGQHGILDVNESSPHAIPFGNEQINKKTEHISINHPFAFTISYSYPDSSLPLYVGTIFNL